MADRRTGEMQRIVDAVVVLVRNTTWKCGKLERLIVNYLHKRATGFGKRHIAVDDMIHKFELTGKKKNEFLDALKRLERRRIVRLLTVQM